MTADPPDPKFSNALAAYRSASNLRKPHPTAQIVRLVDEPAGLAPVAPAPPDQGAATAPGSSTSATGSSAGVSLMITNAQKDSLRKLGVTEDELRDMTPTEAHRRLGLSGR